METSLPNLGRGSSMASYLQRLRHKSIQQHFRSVMPDSKFRRFLMPTDELQKPAETRRKIVVPKPAKFRSGIKSSEEKSIPLEFKRGRLLIPSNEDSYLLRAYDREIKAVSVLTRKVTDPFTEKLMRAADACIRPQKSFHLSPIRPSRKLNQAITPLKEIPSSSSEAHGPLKNIRHKSVLIPRMRMEPSPLKSRQSH
jgi:hypothetical protein